MVWHFRLSIFGFACSWRSLIAGILEKSGPNYLHQINTALYFIRPLKVMLRCPRCTRRWRQSIIFKVLSKIRSARSYRLQAFLFSKYANNNFRNVMYDPVENVFMIVKRVTKKLIGILHYRAFLIHQFLF